MSHTASPRGRAPIPRGEAMVLPRGWPMRAIIVLVVAGFVAVAAVGFSVFDLSARDAVALSIVRTDPTPTSLPVSTVPETSPPTTIQPVTTGAPVGTDPPGTSPPQRNPGTVAPQRRQPPATRSTSNGSRDVADSGSTTSPPTTDDVTITTTQNLLVGPAPTTVTTTTIKPQDLQQTPVASSSAGSDPKVWAIVAGLVVLAVGLGVSTVMYWRRTRPLDDDDEFPDRGNRRSRYSDLVITVPDSQ